jgi:hypothetical protein
MTTTVKKQVLLNARALIADPNHWTRSFLASNAAGYPVHWCDPSAVKWCAMGAIYRGAYELVGSKEAATRIGKEVAKGIAPIWFGRSLMTVNDVRGHCCRPFEVRQGLGGGIGSGGLVRFIPDRSTAPVNL